MTPQWRAAWLILPVLASLAAWQPGCGPSRGGGPAAGQDSGGWPNRWELRRNGQSSGPALLVYGTLPRHLAPINRRRAEAIARAASPLAALVRADTAVQPAELATHPLIVVGSLAGNRLVAELAERLPIGLHIDHLRFGPHEVRGEETVFSLGPYPSPFNRSLPLLLLSGFAEDRIWEKAERLAGDGGALGTWRRAGLNAWQADRRVLVGTFDSQAGWQPDTASIHYFPEQPRLLAKNGPILVRGAVSLAPEPELQAYAAGLHQRLTEIEAWCGKPWPEDSLAVDLFPSIEEKGLQLQNTRPEQADHAAARVYTVWNDTYRDQDGIGLPQLVLRRLLGTPSLEALETGLALHFTERWQYRGYRYWAGRLYHSGNLPPLAALLVPERWERGSSLVLGAAAGALVDFLLETRSREALVRLYSTWRPSQGDIAALQAEWEAWWRRQPPVEEPPAAATPPGYLKGFNFAHEGYDIYNGYGSRLATASLEKLRRLGANAVSIIPYSGMRDPNRPQPLRLDHGPGSESDEAVVFAARSAARLGMARMLKPQLWMRGFWPGDVSMPTDSAWQAWFAHYHDWILHYALLAEIHGFELLCVGTELAGTTLAREADWRRLIGRLRGLYRGKITYAANWGEEFENLAFWDAVDYIGLNCYYPLSSDPQAGPDALREGFRRNLDRVRPVVEREGRPLLLTEIGFTSATAPWVQPHEDGRDRNPQPEHQRLCYQIAFEELAGLEACSGLFWWKFPSYPQHVGRADGIGFTPNNKPAEAVVREWFARRPAGGR